MSAIFDEIAETVMSGSSYHGVALRAVKTGDSWRVKVGAESPLTIGAVDFRRFVAEAAVAGKDLVKVAEDSDGTAVVTHFRSGRLHRDAGPAVVFSPVPSSERAAQGATEIWYVDGQRRDVPAKADVGGKPEPQEWRVERIVGQADGPLKIAEDPATANNSGHLRRQDAMEEDASQRNPDGRLPTERG
jgi:hypothetical protein